MRLDIIRDRNILYRETDMGLMENVYTLKLINMDKREHEYHLSVQGLDGLQLHVAKPEIRVPSGEVLNLPVSVSVDPSVLEKAGNNITFTLTADDEPALSSTESARFVGPRVR